MSAANRRRIETNHTMNTLIIFFFGIFLIVATDHQSHAANVSVTDIKNLFINSI